MNSTMKITSLVAVLGLCLAALAGSAYAYTATYVDTIEDQPIENVYVAINNNATGIAYGKTGQLDLDVEYDSLNAMVGEAYEMYYKVASAKVNDTLATESSVRDFTANVDGQTAIFCGIIDSVKIQAYGDSADGRLIVDGLKTTVDGVIDPIKYTFLDADKKSIKTTQTGGQIEMTDNVTLEAGQEYVYYIQATITVSTLDTSKTMYLHANNTISNTETAETDVAYYAPSKPVICESETPTTLLDDITVEGANVKYVFDAKQTPKATA